MATLRTETKSLATARPRSRASAPSLSRALKVGLALVFLAYTLAPMAWLLVSSFQPRVRLFAKPPSWFPNKIYIENYRAVLADSSLLSALANSFLVAAFATLLSLFVGTLAAYAFARMRVPIKRPLFLFVLGSQMLPTMVLLIPMFVVLRYAGLLYSYAGLILAYLSFTLPYVVWLLRSFFISLPHEVEEASLVDGATRLQTIYRVVLPLSMPGFVSTGIFAFIGAWNEFLLASVLTDSDTKTFPVRLAQYIGQDTTAYETMFAAGIVGSLPVVLLVLVFQRFIVHGLSEGALKG